jgi:anti-anti-sigma factor
MHRDDSPEIAASELGELRVVTFHGEWDVSNREQLHETLESLGSEHDVIVDLRQASFFDSTALAELIVLYKLLSARGYRLETLVGDSNMRRLLELTSLDGLLGVSPERARYLIEQLPPASELP